MKDRLIRCASFALAVLLAALTFASCGKAEGTKDRAGVETTVVENFSAAFISDGSFGTGRSASSGIREFAAENGLLFSEFTPAEDTVAAVTECIDSAAGLGASVIVCEGIYAGDAAISAQTAYPDISFLILAEDAFCESVNGKLFENVHCVGFRYADAGYLAGYAAVCEGYRSLGFASIPGLPSTVDCLGGFAEGVDDACAEYGIDPVPVYCRESEGGVFSGDPSGTLPPEDFFDLGAEAVAAMGVHAAPAVKAAAGRGKVIPICFCPEGADGVIAPYPVFDKGCAAVRALERLLSNGGSWSVRDAGTCSHAGLGDGGVAAVFPEGDDQDGFDASVYEKIKNRVAAGEVRLKTFDDVGAIAEEYANIVFIDE